MVTINGITTVDCPERPEWATEVLERDEIEPVKIVQGICDHCGEGDDETDLLYWSDAALCETCAEPMAGTPIEYIAAYHLWEDSLSRDEAIRAILAADRYCGDDGRGGNWSTGYHAEIYAIEQERAKV
ncbi:MAG: hypothetical protein Q8R78_02525 [Candidatus Omnitrophota bacterium]|nr:hypothetical protein [Candidatus Omnitrophota bacterium]